jgi:hypothetical protein
VTRERKTIAALAGWLLAGLIAPVLAGCSGDADFSGVIPDPPVLAAEEYRKEIVAIDRLVFEPGPVDAARRGALAEQLDALAARVRTEGDSRFLALESLELRRLALGAGSVPPDGIPEPFATGWIRIRNNLFDDRSWFARNAADLEPAEAPAGAQHVETRPAVGSDEAAAELLLPGAHHGDEVPRDADGPWWAICGPAGHRVLKRVPVSIRRVNDPVLDAAGEMTGAEPIALDCDQPLAFLRGVAGLGARALEDGVASPVRDGVSSLRYGTEALEIRRIQSGDTGYRLELHAGGRTQTLFASETGFDWEPELWSVRWVGDLDGDGRADLLLDATDDENVGQTFLFLSSLAPRDVLLRLVAMYRTVGC